MLDDMQRLGKKVAVTGKGGSGKTMLTATMLRLLARNENLKVLAIDADSAINLPYSLGMKFGKTVAEMRGQMIEDPSVRAEVKNKHIKTAMAELLEVGDRFNLLVMGRPEGPGCYCGINELLKYGIESLSKEYDVTLIDCEAGPEQVNRRVVQGVDELIIVTDTSSRGIQVACAISEVGARDEAMRSCRTSLVINRVKDEGKPIAEIAHKQCGLEVIGLIPEDENITKYDLVGKPLIDLPDTSPSVLAVQEILRRIDLRD
ncbi:AAA family ATPase [Chloroflexota bacterium]